MSRLSTSLRLAAVLATVAPFATAAPPTQREASVEPQAGVVALAYSIAFWGIPFGATEYSGHFTDTGYSARSHFETSGIVSVFWQASIDATATGHIAHHALAPDEYDSYFSRGGARKERVKVAFSDGEPVTFADPPYDTTKFPVTAEEKHEAVDPMSAVTLVLTGVRADAANPCGTVAPVFDGRRRYNVTFTYLKDESVKLSDGLFDGRAHLCQLHYEQIAGFKPKILKDGAALPSIFADFADIPAVGAPNGHYVVALKVWSDLSWGTVSAHLIRLSTADTMTAG
jgi:hypothetical protein